MKIHFVCTGNVYRSRFAEAYSNYLIKINHLSNLFVSSSGIMANRDENGPIAWNTVEVLKENNLLKYASPHWTQTTSSIINSQDLIIFMQPLHLHFCQDQLGYLGTNYQIWDIADMIPTSSKEENLQISRQTFFQVKSKVDLLFSNL